MTYSMAKISTLFQLIIVLGTRSSSFGNGQESAQGYDPEASITGLYTGPYFDPLAPRNFTAHLGDLAVLPCTVRQLGDKSVSWVRMRDADILTVDRYTFVGDERFESHYSASLETWNLVIKYVQERDAGLYECQVSTEPKMSQFFSLRVVVPKVEILPPGDRYVKAGSVVRVECQITDVVQLPDYIFWYHEEKRVMDHLDHNLLVAVKKTGVEAITSTLTILKVPAEGSGNYTCMPSNLHTASVILHVLNEKHPAAMQGERSGASLGPRTISYGFPVLFIIVLLYNILYFDSVVYTNEPKYSQNPRKDSSLKVNGINKNNGIITTKNSLTDKGNGRLSSPQMDDFNNPNQLAYELRLMAMGISHTRGLMYLKPASHSHGIDIENKPTTSNGRAIEADIFKYMDNNAISYRIFHDMLNESDKNQDFLLTEVDENTSMIVDDRIHLKGNRFHVHEAVLRLYNSSSSTEKTTGFVFNR